MSLAVTVLLVSLAACAAGWSIHRERMLRSKMIAVASVAGLGANNLNELPQIVAQLIDGKEQLPKEAYLRRLFESLLNEIRQGVVIVDDQLRIKFCNRTAQQLFSRPNLQRGRTIVEELRDHQVTEVVRAAIEKNHRCAREIEVAAASSANGISTKNYLIEAAPLNIGCEPGAWLMIHDITEQTMADQVRKDFVANASHELRTPLTLINGYIEVLQEGGITNPSQQQRSLAVMERHGKRIAQIIEDMLTISKLEIGPSGLDIEPFVMRSCVSDAVERLSHLIEGRDARLEIDFPSDGGHLRGDRFYWDLVFSNLMENSLKENSNPGLVLRVVGKWFESHCEIRVSDNGVGIPSHDLPFIFKRFYRGHKHHSQQIKGSGLGLSIVRRSVEAHGGTIAVTSIPGLDTTFTIKVPVNPPAAATRARA